MNGYQHCEGCQNKVNASTLKHYHKTCTQPEKLLKKLIRAAKLRANENGVPFDISPVDFPGEMPARCPILGIEIAYTTAGEKGPRNASLSIDRIDNALGYIKGNVRLISYRANRLKSDATFAELQAITRDMQLIEAKKLSQH